MEPPQKIIVAALVFVTCAKILCIPAYRSTDFDVHRNWLAITKHLPLKDWYFDDINKSTVHTLDYPPSFSYFEYILSNNPVTTWLISSGKLDERCLALLPDSDNTPSEACVLFQRGTVILSDIILWIGAFNACENLQSFLLIVLNPGLFWLDHIHFQYNGAMLGILLGSLGQILKGGNKTGASYHYYHLSSCFLYALLLTLKHLYLPLAPLYFIYMLSTYCRVDDKFSIQNFVFVATVTGGTLILPFLPFLLQKNPKEQIIQMFARLFPFDRGLVHDYWAGNFWALWMVADKLLQKIIGFQLPHISPSFCALLLLIGLIPGLICAWKCSSKRFLSCVVYCALSSFMLAYHVHEKAIMTALIPLMVSLQDEREKRLLMRVNTLGLVGLFPLLFRPIELPIKVISFLAYWSLMYHLLGEIKLLWVDKLGLCVLAFVVVFLEVLHPLIFFPSMEFLPLLCTSVACAVGLFFCWFSAGCLMVTDNTTKIK